ncbi:MAG: chromate transporter [Microcella sp.]|uniref:chromate transporter n=1 Tax=Microcella sp. TaxID=1913979 RepID=UPI003314BFA3
MSEPDPTTPAQPRRSLWGHTLAMAKVGVIGFGGGSALIPVLERELVRPGQLRETEFVQDTVIANITPGALPVKIAALSGTQLRGTAAATSGAIAVALPGAFATVSLLALFSALGPGAISVVEFASLGISAFILYLLAHYTVKVLAPGGRVRMAGVVIAVVAFLLSGAGRAITLVSDAAGTEEPVSLPELSALGLVLVSLAAIALVTLWQLLRGTGSVVADAQSGNEMPIGTRRALRGALAMVVLSVAGFGIAFVAAPEPSTLSFLGLVLVSTVSSFGGGEAYVGVADGFFVATGLVNSSLFYGQIVPVANALPGPILVKIAAGVAYGVGASSGSALTGVALALAAFLITVGSCSAIALLLLAGYNRARNSLFVRNISAYILPVICGLLASTSLSLLHASAGIAEGAGVPAVVAILGSTALALLVPLIHRLARVPDILLIVAFGALSLTLLSVV